MITFLLQDIFTKFIFITGRLRAILWGFFLKKIGRQTGLASGCRIQSPRNVEIGDYTYINANSTIGGQGGVKIGSFVMIGANCNIVSANHGYEDNERPMRLQGIKCGSVEIEDDVWIGVNVVILPNVKISRGSIIGANAVVTKNVEPYSIIGGIPAKLIKYRFSKDKISKAKQIDLTKFKPKYWGKLN